MKRRVDGFRRAVGQPEVGRALVAAGRAGIARGLRVRYVCGGMDEVLTVAAVYPLRDGSGWAVLFEGSTGNPVEASTLAEVTR